MKDSGKELIDESSCKADEIVTHSMFTASSCRRLQLMYKLGLSLIVTTSTVSILNWLFTISTELTVSTRIDPGDVSLNTQSMMDTLSDDLIVRPGVGRWEKVVA